MDEDRIFNTSLTVLAELRKRAESIAGEWDGDLPGRLEDRAHIATDIVRQVDTLTGFIKEMKES